MAEFSWWQMMILKNKLKLQVRDRQSNGREGESELSLRFFLQVMQVNGPATGLLQVIAVFLGVL